MKIKSIKLVSAELTVDIEVAETHTYQLANGCVSHNTTSKLFGLTEGAHLPSMREYLRWVQFRSDDPLVKVNEDKGYPVKQLKTYSGTTVVGFPTQPEICKLGMEEKLVTAPEATLEEQYLYLQLLEKYWIVGVDEDGVTPLSDTGNQISYTAKFFTKDISFAEYFKVLIEGQSKIKCCSVMPTGDLGVYEYTPEAAVTKAEYEMILDGIKEDNNHKEDIDMETLACGTGACPI